MSEPDDEYYKIILEEFGVPEIFRDLTYFGITYDMLAYLSEQDMQDPLQCVPLPQRTIFQEKLFNWKNREVNEMLQTYQKRCVAPIPCFQCGKSFLNVDNFINHLESDHTLTNSIVQCKMNQCNKNFVSCAELKRHILEKHVF